MPRQDDKERDAAVAKAGSAPLAATLAARKTHGPFKAHAALAQALKNRMRAEQGWDALAPDMRESLDMVMHKVARILTGDPRHADHWHDLAGYSTLVEGGLDDEA